MEKSKIRLTEESVLNYWKVRSASDGMRATGHAAYTLVEQNKRYEIRKEFIFNFCPKILRTLDYGCGIGRYVKDFKHYLGVEMTGSILSRAKRRCPKAMFLKLKSPFLERKLNFKPELIFTANVLQHNPDNLVLKIFESFVPIVEDDIMFGFYENIEVQARHVRGRTGEDYVDMIRKFFKVYEWESQTHKMNEEHAFTLIKAGRK